MTNPTNREELYKKIRELEKKSSKKPKKLQSENGTFFLNPNKKADKEWFEDDGSDDNFGARKNE